MADIYMYADETGNLDYAGAGKAGASDYFGFGTAVFRDDHGAHLYGGLQLRAKLEARGLHLPKGFHAVDDAKRTRNEMFSLIKEQAPRFDTTFLCKSRAYSYVRQKGEMYLYKMAWYLHFKEIALQVSTVHDDLYVIVGSIATSRRKTLAQAAIEDVCQQLRMHRVIHLCHWNAPTCWGLQVADYGLWAVHRDLLGKNCQWFATCVKPTLSSFYLPWGRTT